MTDETKELEQTELEGLKARASQLGISFHPSIGLDKLREKVTAALTDDKPEAKKDEPKKESEFQRIKRLKAEAHRLVRIRVTCMNPAKKDWEGEIFTVGNSVVGSVKKFVPFNVEDGWHVPHIMYEMLRERMCQIFVNGKTQSGVTKRESKLIREFAVEILPDLSKQELQELAQRQAMGKTGE